MNLSRDLCLYTATSVLEKIGVVNPEPWQIDIIETLLSDIMPVTTKTNMIIGVLFSNRLRKLIFKIKNLSSNTTRESTASKLSVDDEFISSLSPKDAYMIGYAVALDKQEDEKNKIKEFRSSLFTAKKTVTYP